MDTVVIDIDGTLVDSNYHHVVAWARAFAAHEVEVPLWRIHRALGMGGDRLVAAVAGQDTEKAAGDAIRERWEKEYDVMIGETRLFDGATLLLDTCRERGYAVVLASSSIPKHARHALDLLDAEERADAWTTAADAEQSKPDPELIDAALDRVGGGRAVMIGDTVWDVQAARARGLQTICLLSGGVGRDELEQAGAVAVFDDLCDLIRHLDDALRCADEA